MEKMASDEPKRGQEDFFPTNPDLADILGRTDLNFEKLCLFFLDPTFLDFQLPRSRNSRISRSPDLQIPRFPDAAGAGQTLRSQPVPSPKRTQGSNTSQGALAATYI